MFPMFNEFDMVDQGHLEPTLSPDEMQGLDESNDNRRLLLERFAESSYRVMGDMISLKQENGIYCLTVKSPMGGFNFKFGPDGSFLEDNSVQIIPASRAQSSMERVRPEDIAQADYYLSMLVEAEVEISGGISLVIDQARRWLGRGRSYAGGHSGERQASDSWHNDGGKERWLVERLG